MSRLTRLAGMSAFVAFVTLGCGPRAALNPEAPSEVGDALVDSAFAEIAGVLRPGLRRIAGHRAGVAVAVYHGGHAVWIEGAGYADLESRLAVDPDRTRFRIYSVAKPMTAVAAARLAEAGSLEPEAPVQRYVPSFPEKSAPVTTMQIATHTAGIRHYANEDEAYSTRRCETVEEALGQFADDPLLYEPGSSESYSSWGFVLLSAVVEGVAGVPFLSAMDSLVFTPAGMDDVALDGEAAAFRARPYEEVGGPVRDARHVDNSCKWGAGGFVATAEDVGRFGAAMLDGSIISPRSLQLFLRGRSVYRASGFGIGGSAVLLIDANHDLAIALLSNTSGETSSADLGQLAEDIHASVSAWSSSLTPAREP